ncbi:MAG: hypothetical protein MJ252_03310 [archaeon]|nr:hypothetical protein [archaeon]
MEKIQKEFSEKINSILSQIESYEIAQSSSANSLESRYKNRITEINYDKDRIIDQLKNELENVKKDNESISNRMNTQMEENRNKIFLYQNNIKELEQKLIKKEEELFITKSQMEGLITQYQKTSENEKIRTESEYEKKIQSILKESEIERDKLLGIIKQREEDIQNVIKNNQEQSNDLLNTARKLKEDNIKLTNDYQNILTKQKVMQENAENIPIGNSNYKTLVKEKETILNDMNNLEAMIYGKIKPFLNNQKVNKK